MTNPFKDLAEMYAKGEALNLGRPRKGRLEGPIEEPTSGCAECDYTGWEVGESGRAGGYRRCKCSKPSVERLLLRAGVPPKEVAYSEAWLIDHAPHLQRRRADTMKAVGSGESVLLIGPPGRGKTGVAVLILRELVQSSPEAHVVGYHYVPDLLATFRSFIDNKRTSGSEEGEPASERALYAALMRPQTVLLDDLGAEKPSDWVREQILRILRGRDALDKPTIITSNLGLEHRKGTRSPSLELFYGRRIVSRLQAYREVGLPPGMPDLRKS